MNPMNDIDHKSTFSDELHYELTRPLRARIRRRRIIETILCGLIGIGFVLMFWYGPHLLK
jgi:hypothetical protein